MYSGNVLLQLRRPSKARALFVSTLFACSLGVSVAALSQETSREMSVLYVAPEGNDSWSGRVDSPTRDGADGPLATIEGARNRIRSLKEKGTERAGTRVLVRGGTYFVSAPILFGPDDSGKKGKPISYEAYPGERPVIHGGQPIAGWRQEGDVWVAPVPDGLTFSALWVNGKRATPARTPNATHYAGDEPDERDFFYAAGPVKETDPSTGKTQSSNTKFRFRDGDLQAWSTLGDARVVVFHSWATSLLRVKKLDLENHVVEFTGPARWSFGRWKKDQRYYVEHLREGLDVAGEWYLDREGRKLFYKPFPDEDMTEAEVIAPVARQLLVLRGNPEREEFVEYLHFNGLTFRYTEYPLEAEGHSDAQAAYAVNAAVEATGARHCRFEGCEVSRIGNYAVWLRTGCQDNRIEGCDLFDLGAGGIRLGEGGSPAGDNEAVERNVAENNYIRDGGRIFRSACGVWIGRSSYNRIAHNEISDFRYTGVSVGWSWGYAASSAHDNVIEYNHIHHIGRGQLNDMGGIYCLGVSPGTVLRGNLIHDVVSHPRLYGGWGIYTDEGSTGILIENNVVYNTRTGGFHQHYGRDNRVQNNIFAYSQGGQIIRSREEDHNSFFFERNIVYFDNGKLLGSTWKNGNYVFDNNCYWDTSGSPVTFSGKSLKEWQESGKDGNSIVADPLFVDPARGDYRLKPGSPVFALGFKAIDVSKVGPSKAEAHAAPVLLEVKKIWDQGGHNAFTDIIRFRDTWFCTFREADGHVKGDGKIRIITSIDGDAWTSAGLLAEEGIDLRDPKLSVTPDDRLMVTAGGSVYRGGKRVGMQPRVAFSSNGGQWGPTIRVVQEGQWLWRVTWHDGKAYGVNYVPDGKGGSTLELVASEDGVDYKAITTFDIAGRPNETTLRFLQNGTLMALVRQEAGNHHGWIGVSTAPYTEWDWKTAGHQLGGPDFIELPDGSLWAGSRSYPGGAKTVLARLDTDSYEPVLTLPSGGDCSYPGMVWHEGLLWMSYYSSHEGKTSIYLAKIRLP